MNDKEFIINILGFAVAIFLVLMACAAAFGISAINSL